MSRGYAFALPRCLARLAGWRVRRARLSRWETYAMGVLVFGLSCVFTGRWLFAVVRPFSARFLLLLTLPFAIWIAWLALFYLISLLLKLLRKTGACSQISNHDFQHAIITCLITLIAVILLRDASDWMRSLGAFWLALVMLNLISAVALRFLDEG